MKLLLPIAAIFEHHQILRALSNICLKPEPVPESEEQLKILAEKDDFLSNLSQFHKEFQEYLKTKEFSDEVRSILKPNETMEDPFPLFLLAISTTILMFIRTYQQKIINSDIDEIEIVFSASITTDFESHSKYSFSELMKSLNWALDTRYLLDINYLGRILLVFFQLWSKIMAVLYRFQSIANMDTFKDDDVIGQLLDKETLFMLNLNLDPAYFQPYEFNNRELECLENIHFNSVHYVNTSAVNNDRNGDIYYFIEHIDHLKWILKQYKNHIGLSVNNENYYSREYFNIEEKLEAIAITDKFKGEELFDYPIDLFTAIGIDIEGKIKSILEPGKETSLGFENGKDSKERYVFILGKNDLFINELRDFLKEKLNKEFQRIYPLEIIKKTFVGKYYLIVDGIDELSEDKLDKLWIQLKRKALREGFVIFTGNKIPDYLKRRYNFTSQLLRLDDKLIEKNYSKIFHAIVTKKYKHRVKITRATKDNINLNKYRKLFPAEKLDLMCLHDAIASISETMQFDYSSARSWYSIVIEYQENLESLKTEEVAEDKKLVNFVFDGNQWLIDGIADEIIPEKKFKGILYIVLALLYYQEYGKGIEYQHLATISDYYEKQIKPHLKASGSKSKRDSKKNPESSHIRYGDRISGAVKGEDAENFDAALKKFIKDHIKFENNHVNYYEKSDFRYRYAVNEELKIDNSLFKNNYLDVLRRKK